MGNKVTTKEHLGQLFQAWNNTYLGWVVQQSGKFPGYMEWAKFLSNEPNTYISEHGLFEIIPEGKRLAKLPVYPFQLGDFVYNALLEDALKTAFNIGFEEVLVEVKTTRLQLFKKPEQKQVVDEKEEKTVEEELEKLGIGLEGEENGTAIQHDEVIPKSNNKSGLHGTKKQSKSKRRTKHKPEFYSVQPV